jgi:hypothetical protein
MDLSFDRELQGKLFIFLFAALAIYLASSADSLATQAASLGAVLSFLIYLVSNFSYVLTILVAVTIAGKDKELKGFVAGVLLVLAFDIVSLPHCVPISGETPVINNLCSDTIVINALKPSLGSFAYWLYYAIIPIVFVVIAAELLGAAGLINKLRQQAG